MEGKFPKDNLLSQYWQNDNTKVKGKLLVILNCNVLETGRRRNFKFGENAL